MSDIRRREFITLIGGAAAAWPLAARAQQGGHMRRIGVLVNLPADDPESQARVGAFLQGLREFGWAIGRNVRIALPGPLQGYTVYEAAMLSKGSTDQAATAFVKYLASALAAAYWEAAKLEPATTYMPTRAGR